MNPNKIIQGQHILIVDDEQDVLETLSEILGSAKLDQASHFEEAKQLLENNDYDLAILDIMGVYGFDLLAIAHQRGIPALMLTANGLSEENLKCAAAEGASYYVPKDEMTQIATFVADVLEAESKKTSPWVKFFMRLGGYYDWRFGGTDWREKEKEFWQQKLQRLV